MICPHCGAEIDLQSKGGHARAAKLSDARRKEIASKASRTRWDKVKTEAEGQALADALLAKMVNRPKRTVPVPASGQSEGNETTKPSRKVRR